MPKATYSRQLLHATDADFRQWAADLSTALKACLTQTADTGQVDWTLGTQTRPVTTSYPHYEIYRFSDTLQATKPIFIKVEYGTGNVATTPGIRISIASGTNGAGTLTGITYVSLLASSLNAPGVPAASTWVCGKDGYFGILWGGVPSPSIGLTHLFLAFDRTRDSAGVGTPNGYYWVNHNATSGGGAASSYSNDIAAVVPVISGGNCLIPNYTTQTSVAAKAKLFPHRCFTPDEYAATGMLGYLGTEFNPYTEFDVAPLPGMATQRYLACSNYGLSINAMASSQYLTAMRYET